MTSRQVGRRRPVAVDHRRKRGGQRRREETLTPQERRRLFQLVACGTIFVLLVAAKLLLPARMAAFNETLSNAMGQNMDLQAVFSAVGRAFAGDGDPASAVESVYQAVFHPESTGGEPASAAVPENLPSGAALLTLQNSRKTGSTPEDTTLPDASNLAYVLYSQENLPENVSMEQTILGFDYCTPIQGTLTSVFGYREHPVEGEERFHYGIDLAADTGAEILCFADGTVTAVGESSSYGKYCIVAHENGFSTLYAHCSRIVVSSGTSLTQGQKLAEVGQTGMATGPHLHFELQQNGLYLNPIYYVSTV